MSLCVAAYVQCLDLSSLTGGPHKQTANGKMFPICSEPSVRNVQHTMKVSKYHILSLKCVICLGEIAFYSTVLHDGMRLVLEARQSHLLQCENVNKSIDHQRRATCSISAFSGSTV